MAPPPHRQPELRGLLARWLRRLATAVAPAEPPAPGVTRAPHEVEDTPRPRTGGPPEHWLAVVRARAPHLLDGLDLTQATTSTTSTTSTAAPAPAPSFPRVRRFGRRVRQLGRRVRRFGSQARRSGSRVWRSDSVGAGRGRDRTAAHTSATSSPVLPRPPGAVSLRPGRHTGTNWPPVHVTNPARLAERAELEDDGDDEQPVPEPRWASRPNPEPPSPPSPSWPAWPAWPDELPAPRQPDRDASLITRLADALRRRVRPTSTPGWRPLLGRHKPSDRPPGPGWHNVQRAQARAPRRPAGNGLAPPAHGPAEPPDPTDDLPDTARGVADSRYEATDRRGPATDPPATRGAAARPRVLRGLPELRDETTDLRTGATNLADRATDPRNGRRGATEAKDLWHEAPDLGDAVANRRSGVSLAVGWSARDGREASAAGQGPWARLPGSEAAVPAAPWPELPDDSPLWTAPRPAFGDDHVRRLDREQKGW